MKLLHELKCLPMYFHAIKDGRKPFDVRPCADREFREGQSLILRCWDPKFNCYTDDEPIRAKITFVLPGGRFGIEDGYCVLGLDVELVFEPLDEPLYVHKSTDRVYAQVGVAFAKSDIKDGAPVVLYAGVSGGLYVRDVANFEDRFEVRS